MLRGQEGRENQDAGRKADISQLLCSSPSPFGPSEVPEAQEGLPKGVYAWEGLSTADRAGCFKCSFNQQAAWSPLIRKGRYRKEI